MVEQENKTAIIDIDSILFHCAWGHKISDGKGGYLRDDKGRLIYRDKTNLEISVSIDNTLHAILQNTNATHYIIYVKGKNTAAHRYSAKPDYKANRPKQSPSWWEYAKGYVIEAWKAIPSNDLESDDSCNIARLMIPNSFMVALDKDLINLEGTHYNWKTQEWITVTKQEAHDMFWSDMICGQSGDGISGLIGRGIVYYNKILKRYPNQYLAPVILSEYIKEYGEEIGIQEYYKNYTCLKILDDYKDFVLPEPIKYEYSIEETKEEDLFKEL